MSGWKTAGIIGGVISLITIIGLAVRASVVKKAPGAKYTWSKETHVIGQKATELWVSDPVKYTIWGRATNYWWLYLRTPTNILGADWTQPLDVLSTVWDAQKKAEQLG